MVRLPPFDSTNKKILLITPHPRPTGPRCPQSPICPQKNKTPPRFPLRVSDRSDRSNRSDRSDTQALSEQRKAEKPDPEKAGCKAPVLLGGGAKHPFLGRGCKAPVSWAAQFRFAHLPPGVPPHRLGHSNGAAGAFLGLIGLLRLIG